MKRNFAVLRILWGVLLLLSALGAQASEAFNVDAKSAVLIEAESGRILYAQNADEPLPMASTTKIMTCLLAIENAEMDELVTAGKNASGVPGTSIYLAEGETLSMEQLLYGLMLRSGNDAAVAIAEHISGDTDAFAQTMNARATELGANAHFVNPHGLDAEGHSASALAMARIMREGMKHDAFRAITSTQKKIIPWVGNEYSRVLENKNRLLRTYEGASGGKTGFTSRAGRCLVFSAERAGMTLIGTVLNCPTWFDTAAVLLDYGFENYRLETPLEAGQTAVEVAVEGGDAPVVAAVASKRLSVPIGIGEHFALRYDFGDGVHAPVKAGETIGRAILEINGEVVSECALNAAADVDELGFLNALRKVLQKWTALFES